MYKTKCCNSIEYTFKKQMIGINEHYRIHCLRCDTHYHIPRTPENYGIHKHREIISSSVSKTKLETFFGI